MLHPVHINLGTESPSIFLEKSGKGRRPYSQSRRVHTPELPATLQITFEKLNKGKVIGMFTGCNAKSRVPDSPHFGNKKIGPFSLYSLCSPPFWISWRHQIRNGSARETQFFPPVPEKKISLDCIQQFNVYVFKSWSSLNVFVQFLSFSRCVASCWQHA